MDAIVDFLTEQVQLRVVAPPEGTHAEREGQWGECWGEWMSRIDSDHCPPKAQEEELRIGPTTLATDPGVYHLSGLMTPDECIAVTQWGSVEGATHAPPDHWSPTLEAADVSRRVVVKLDSGDPRTPLSPAAAAALDAVVVRTLHLLRLPEHFASTSEVVQVTFSAPESVVPNSPTIGLHVDQNNGNPTRWATVLVYLNDVDPGAGGGTIFPLAQPDGGDSTIGQALLDNGITSTSEACVLTIDSPGEVSIAPVDGTDAAAALTALARDEAAGVRTEPRRGDGVLFFSATPAAPLQSSPRSWHCGGSVAGSTGKWTLQIFLTLPVDVVGAPNEARAFLQAHTIVE